MRKRNSFMKRCICIFLAVILIAAVPVVPTEKVQAASGSSWKKAYADILSNWKRVDKYYDTSYLRMYFGRYYKFDQYFLYDLNRDQAPELFLHSTSMGLTMVFTYRNRLTALGYFDIYGLNPAKQEILVQGHWHGAGGSGTREWSIYRMSGSRIQNTYYIDYLGGRYSVYNYISGSNSNSGRLYRSIYNSHIKNCKKFSSFKKYRLSDRSRLNYYSAPAKPTLSSVSRAGSGKLKLTWKKVSGASGYQIYRSIHKNSGYRKIKTISGKSAPVYTDRGLRKGRRYYYKIRAYRKTDTRTYYGKFSSIKSNRP